MKKIMLLLFTVFVMLSCSHKPGWKLVWEENFDGTELDTTVWSRIPRAGQTGRTHNLSTTVAMKCVTDFSS